MIGLAAHSGSQAGDGLHPADRGSLSHAPRPAQRRSAAFAHFALLPQQKHALPDSQPHAINEMMWGRLSQVLGESESVSSGGAREPVTTSLMVEPVQ